MARGFHEPGEKPRRFYKAVSVAPAEGGYAVLLDDRQLRGPKGGRVILPTRALADQVAEEWAAQGERLDLARMHATRLANTAIESVPLAREATAQAIADYAASDLLCYYATEPAGLLARQESLWGPVLDRVETDATCASSAQRGSCTKPSRRRPSRASRRSPWSSMTSASRGSPSGPPCSVRRSSPSACSAAGFRARRRSPSPGWDEAWQEEKWGIDAEAAERTERLAGEADMLDRWFRGLAD